MNLLPLLEQLYIVDTRAQVIPFQLNWAQREFLDTVHTQYSNRRPVRIITLKARQLGVSTLTEALMFLWCFLFERAKGLVIAHEVDSGQHLLGMTETYWETYPYRHLYTPKYQSKNELAWRETGSSLKVSTAANTKAGRSRTLQALHASEVAFWEKASTTMLGLTQALHSLHGTLGVIESTANGVGGFFYEQWNAAVEGDTEYTPLFFPWHKHPAYTFSHLMRTTPPDIGKLSDEERILHALGVSDDSLQWRRWAIRNLTQNKLEQFHQEYPSTPEEAFITTGTNVFPITHLAHENVYQPFEGMRGRLFRESNKVKFLPDITGPLTIFAFPSSDTDFGKYLVAGDPTHVTQGDNAAIQVINRRTYEQVAVWHGKIDPGTFAEEIAKCGIYYNTAIVTVEVEGPGYMTIGALLQMDYPHIWRHRWADKDPGIVGITHGWSTSHKRKEWAIGHLLKLIIDHDITIHHRQTFMELKDYITLPAGAYGPASSSGYDDLVMSLAIACICNSTEVVSPYSGPLSDEEPPDTWQSWNETA